MDLRKVKKLIELLEESDIAEIEVHENDESVRISRHSSAAPAAAGVQQPAAIAVPPVASPAAPASPAATVSGDKAVAAEGEEWVKAPIIGTFYRASAPGKPSFIEEGDAVEAGQTLCIIEAMKMMNQIEAPVSGTLKKFMLQDADPVEFGQTIAVIQT